jgi:hypothetical protein
MASTSGLVHRDEVKRSGAGLESVVESSSLSVSLRITAGDGEDGVVVQISMSMVLRSRCSMPWCSLVDSVWTAWCRGSRVSGVPSKRPELV